jgi:hypothetical protein
MTELLTSPLRAGRHLAIWIVWHSTGVSLVGHDERD